jgi:hypothetical protein
VGAGGSEIDVVGAGGREDQLQLGLAAMAAASIWILLVMATVAPLRLDHLIRQGLG